jgi:membrane associated rhomboid family serine protease
VICKSCGSEVSPYITECPYCGNRVRKRAPKLDRHGRVAEKRRPPTPSLGRLRRGEIPGIRADSRPYVTLALVAAGLIGCFIWRTGWVQLNVFVIFNGVLGQRWWRVFVSPFIYLNMGYAFVALTIIVIYGTLMEHRHGPVPVVLLVLAGGVGGIALTAEAATNAAVVGGNGAALALLTAWAMQDLITLQQKRDIDGDLLGTAVLAGAMALMPIAAPEASWVADGVGILAGVVIGYPLARIHPQ